MGCGISTPTFDTVEGDAPRTLYAIVPFFNPCSPRALHAQTVAALGRLATRLDRTYSQHRLVVVSIEVVHLSGMQAPGLVRTDNEGDIRTLVYASPQSQVLWAKEDLINIAIGFLRRRDNPQYIAWIDGGVALDEGGAWVRNTMNAIDGVKAVSQGGAFVQMFATAILLGADHTATSFGARHALKSDNITLGQASTDCDTSGAWAADASTLYALADARGGAALMDRTLGTADRHMAMALLGKAAETVPSGVTFNYRQHILAWQADVKRLSVGLGVVAGTLCHLAPLPAVEPWDILRRHEFSPRIHMKRVVIQHSDPLTMLQWTWAAPTRLLADVRQYLEEQGEEKQGEDGRKADEVPPWTIAKPAQRAGIARAGITGAGVSAPRAGGSAARAGGSATRAGAQGLFDSQGSAVGSLVD